MVIVLWLMSNASKPIAGGFANFPERGMRRDDLFLGLRVVGFERRVTIAFHVGADTVTFLRILYGGRDIDALMMS